VAQRRHPRFRVDLDVTVNSLTAGPRIPGNIIDISESGLACVLPLQLPLQELVELNFILLGECLKVSAVVRNQNAFRHGFEFVNPEILQSAIMRGSPFLTVCG